jgi:hypothetical protein
MSTTRKVSVESLFLPCIIDTKEQWKVVTSSIPGAFLQAETMLTKLPTKVDPDLYTKFIAKENHGEDIMYVKLTRALYGTLWAVSLFWKDLCGYLVAHGFVLNLFDECMVKKVIDRTQCTIFLFVNDPKILYAHEATLEDLL